MSDDLVIHWSGLESPRADTLVLFHGLTDSGSCWADAVSRWGPRYRIAAVDARGHGQSPRFAAQELDGAPGDIMVLDALDVVRAVATGGSRVVVVGHSMGGVVASAIAGQSGVIRGALLEEPAWFDPGEEDRVDNAAEWVEAVEPFHIDLAAAIAAGRIQNPLWPETEFPAWGVAKTQTDLAFLRRGTAVPTAPWIDLVSAIAVPALVMTGDRDVIMDTHKLSRLEALGNPAIEASVVAGAGHCVRRDRGDAFHVVADAWIATRFMRP